MLNPEQIKYLVDYYAHLIPLEEKSKLKYPYLQEKELTEERKRIAIMLLTDYKDKVFLNNCPKCGYLARTPFAQQCRKCWQSWHGA